jgi:hypothetical protein
MAGLVYNWPMLSNRLWFSAIMLALAALHKWLGFDSLSVGLGVAAIAPWILPEVRSLVSSIKLPGGLELEFQKLQETVEAQQVALEGGVGGKPEPEAASVAAAAATGGAHATHSSAVSFSAPAAEEDVRPVDPIDPNRGQFGSSPVSDGLRLSANVTPFPGSDQLFRIHAWVAAESGPKLETGTKVRFYPHPTFRRRVLDALAGNDGTAAIDLVAWGAFTLGAVVSRGGRETRLELDLATLRDAPEVFKSR